MQANNTHSKIDQQKLNEFMQKAAGDIASTLSAMLLIIGDRLGLYKAWQILKSPLHLKN
jgi:acetylglutamate kinase